MISENVKNTSNLIRLIIILKKYKIMLKLLFNKIQKQKKKLIDKIFFLKISTFYLNISHTCLIYFIIKISTH